MPARLRSSGRGSYLEGKKLSLLSLEQAMF
jgi:hypothetical protein